MELIYVLEIQSWMNLDNYENNDEILDIFCDGHAYGKYAYVRICYIVFF